MRLRALTAGTLVAVVVFALPFLAFAQDSTTPSGSGTPGTTSSMDTGTSPTGTPSTDASDAPGAQDGKANAQGPSVGAEARAKAHAAVAERLTELLESGVIQNENAQANIEAAVERLLSDTMASGVARSEAEALAEVEAALEAKGPEHSAAELDILAEVQARQGKKAEALETLKTRLEANPRTRAAYEKYVALETELGTKQDLDTFVEGKKVEWDVRPFVEDNRTLVPVRKLVEALGADVAWNPETRQVTIVRGNTTIVLTVGSQVALVNGTEVQLDVPAQVVPGGRTVIPLRFVSENLGLNVTWLGESRTIVVTEEPVQ